MYVVRRRIRKKICLIAVYKRSYNNTGTRNIKWAIKMYEANPNKY